MKKSYVKKSVLSYLSVLLIPLLSSVVIYGVMFAVLMSLIEKTQTNSFAAISDTAEADFMRAFTQTHRITTQNAYIMLSSIPSARFVDDENFTQIKNSLSAIAAESGYMKQAAISFPGGFFISDTGITENEYFFGDLSYMTGESEEKIQTLYEQNKNEDFALLPCGNHTLAVIRLYGIAESSAVWIIDNAKYTAQIRELLNYDACVFSVYCKGEEVLRVQNGNPDFKQKNIRRSVGKKSGLTFTYVASSENYNGIIVPLWILFALSVIASGAISLCVLIKKVKTSKAYHAHNLLSRLLRGLPLPDCVENICREYDLNLVDKKLAVLITESADLNEKLQQLPEQEQEESKRNIEKERYRIAVESFAGGGASVYAVDWDDCGYYVVAFDKNESDENITAQIKSAAKEYQRIANETYCIYVSVYISDIVSNPQRLYKARRHVDETRTFGSLLGSENEIIFFSQTRVPDEVVTMDIEGYNLFVNLLKEKDFADAYKQLTKIALTALSNQTKEIVQVRLYSIIDRLIIELNKATAAYGAEFLHELDYAHKLLSVHSVKKLRETCEEIFTTLDGYEKENGRDSAQWVEDVKEYVNEHYADVALSVSDLAERFHFSLSHFSRVFKQQAGMGVFEYIQYVRIEEAKKLLEHGVKVEDAAKTVGFLARGPFIKAFKKKEGITPAQYKHK